MDFSGRIGRVIDNPVEAQSAAMEEGHAWRVRHRLGLWILPVNPPKCLLNSPYQPPNMIQTCSLCTKLFCRYLLDRIGILSLLPLILNSFWISVTTSSPGCFWVILINLTQIFLLSLVKSPVIFELSFSSLSISCHYPMFVFCFFKLSGLIEEGGGMSLG